MSQVSPEKVLQRDQERVIAIIRNPTGRNSVYDFKNSYHLSGFLNEDLKDETAPVVQDLRQIVNDALEGRPIKRVAISQNNLVELDRQLWDIIQTFDGYYLTLMGCYQLQTFMERVLRAKYYVPGSQPSQYSFNFSSQTPSKHPNNPN